MRISDWSSDVCSSDLSARLAVALAWQWRDGGPGLGEGRHAGHFGIAANKQGRRSGACPAGRGRLAGGRGFGRRGVRPARRRSLWGRGDRKSDGRGRGWQDGVDSGGGVLFKKNDKNINIGEHEIQTIT